MPVASGTARPSRQARPCPRRAVPPQGPMTHRAVPIIKEQGLYDFSLREKEGKVIKSLLYGRIWGKMSVRKTK